MILICLAILLCLSFLFSSAIAQDAGQKDGLAIQREFRALREKDPKQALAQAEKWVREYSGRWVETGGPEFHRLMQALNLLLETNELPRVVKEIEAERAKMPSDARLTAMLAELYETSRRTADADKLYRDLWQKSPSDPFVNWKVAGAFVRANQMDAAIKALNVVWQKSPQMMLADPFQTGQLYSQMGRTDGLVEGFQQLSKVKLNRIQSDNMTQLLFTFQGGKLTPEQLAKINEAVFAAANGVNRQRFAGSRMMTLQYSKQEAQAFELGMNEIIFLAKKPTGTDGLESVNVATQSVSIITALGQRLGRLKELIAKAESLAKEPAPWGHVGQLALASAKRHQGDEKPLVTLSRELRVQLAADEPKLPTSPMQEVPHDLLLVLYGRQNEKLLVRDELMQCVDPASLKLCQEWLEADDAALVKAQKPLQPIRMERARLAIRMRQRDEALRLFKSVIPDLPADDMELHNMEMVASQLLVNSFEGEAIRVYRRMLNDILPTWKNVPLQQEFLKRISGMTSQATQMLIERAKSGTLEASEIKAAVESLLAMIFAAGDKEMPVLTVQVNDIGKARAGNNATPPIPGVAPELPKLLIRLARSSGELTALRKTWGQHPHKDSVPMIALRAEASAADGDEKELDTLLAKVPDLERTTGLIVPLWSSSLMFRGFSKSLSSEFNYDFTGRHLDRDLFDITGKSPWLTKPDDAGLHIRLPAGTGPIGHVGAMTKFRIHGDFDILATYELLAVEKPVPPKNYAGCMLICEYADSEDHTNLRREMHDSGFEGITAHHHMVSAQGQANDAAQFRRTKTKKGQLRLIRRGSQMTWLSRDDGDSDYHVQQQKAGPTNDVVRVKVCIDSWGTNNLVEVRWTNLTLRAASFVNLPSQFIKKPTADVFVANTISQPTPPTTSSPSNSITAATNSTTPPVTAPPTESAETPAASSPESSWLGTTLVVVGLISAFTAAGAFLYYKLHPSSRHF